MRKHLLAFGAFLALSPCLTAQRIGVINTMSGPEAPIGEHLTNGIKLAEEDLQKRGFRVQLVWEDDGGNPRAAMAAMEKLAREEKVAGVVGPYTSACAHAASRLAEKRRVPLLIPSAAKEEITRRGLQFVFRLNAPAGKYASSLIDAGMALGHPKTIALVYENTDFGTSASMTAKAYALRKGLQVVAEVPYPKGFDGFRTLMAQVKAAQPDLVFMVSYLPEAILLMRGAKEVALQPQAFLGAGAGFSTAEFAREREVSENVLSCAQWTKDVNWPGAKDFAVRYQARFGKAPTYHAACAYAAMTVLAETARKAGGNRAKILRELKAGTWNGVMGKVDFADFDGFTNQNDHPMLVQQVIAGAHETVLPAPFATRKAVYPFPEWK